MDTQLLGMATLLRAALREERLTLPEGFDLEAAIPPLQHQRLCGLAWRGANLCGCPTQAIEPLRAGYCSEVLCARLQIKQLHQVYALFDRHGVDYLPMKGASVRTLYPQPELRTMGDADILFRWAQYPLIQTLLPPLGFQEKTESDHELIWQINGGLKLELHKSLTSTTDRRFFALYGDGWSSARKDEGPSAAWHLLPEAEYVYLLQHMAGHYQIGGGRVRSLCDLWLYRRAHPEMDDTVLTQALDALRLTAFHRNVLDLLAVWFEGKPSTPAADRIGETLFYGADLSMGGVLAGGTAEMLQSAPDSTTWKWRWVLRKIFPPRSAMQRYPLLHRFPFLLPLFWVVRLVEAPFREPGRISRNLAAVGELARTDDAVFSQRRQALQAVGLGLSDEEDA